MMKLIEEEYRLPLVPMNPKNWDSAAHDTQALRCFEVNYVLFFRPSQICFGDEYFRPYE